MKTRTLILIYLFGIVITACRGQFTLCMPSVPDVTCNYALPMQQSVMLDCNNINVVIPSSSEWYFTSHFSVDVANEIMLNPSAKYDIERHQLFIRNATINDTGIYRCIVNSGIESFNGTARYNLTVLKVPQFTDAVQRINVTEGDDIVLHYEITYTDGIGSALLVDNVQIRNGSIDTIINCNTIDGTCNTLNNDNMRISPSIVDTSDRINANVTVSNAVAQDGGEYLAIASATFMDTILALLYTSSYTATIIVEITDPTPTPLVSTTIVSLISASPSLSALPSVPTTSVQPSESEPNLSLVISLTALAVITVLILLSILVIIVFLIKYGGCLWQTKEQHYDDTTTDKTSNNYCLENHYDDVDLSKEYNSEEKTV